MNHQNTFFSMCCRNLKFLVNCQYFKNFSTILFLHHHYMYVVLISEFPLENVRTLFGLHAQFNISCCVHSYKGTAGDVDGNIGKTIGLLTQDKRCMWICEIKLKSVLSCSQMRLLHFCSGEDAGVNGISAKIETYRVTKVKILKDED